MMNCSNPTQKSESSSVDAFYPLVLRSLQLWHSTSTEIPFAVTLLHRELSQSAPNPRNATGALLKRGNWKRC